MYLPALTSDRYLPEARALPARVTARLTALAEGGPQALPTFECHFLEKIAHSYTPCIVCIEHLFI